MVLVPFLVHFMIFLVWNTVLKMIVFSKKVFMQPTRIKGFSVLLISIHKYVVYFLSLSIHYDCQDNIQGSIYWISLIPKNAHYTVIIFMAIGVILVFFLFYKWKWMYRGSPTYTKITYTVSTNTFFGLCTCKWGNQR